MWGDVGFAWKRKKMQHCPTNHEIGGLRAYARVHSLSQHSNFVFDATLLPLQSLFRDALHRKHSACQPLLGQDNLRKRSSVNRRIRPVSQKQIRFKGQCNLPLSVTYWFSNQSFYDTKGETNWSLSAVSVCGEGLGSTHCRL